MSLYRIFPPFLKFIQAFGHRQGASDDYFSTYHCRYSGNDSCGNLQALSWNEYGVYLLCEVYDTVFTLIYRKYCADFSMVKTRKFKNSAITSATPQTMAARQKEALGQ